MAISWYQNIDGGNSTSNVLGYISTYISGSEPTTVVSSSPASGDQGEVQMFSAHSGSSAIGKIYTRISGSDKPTAALYASDSAATAYVQVDTTSGAKATISATDIQLLGDVQLGSNSADPTTAKGSVTIEQNLSVSGTSTLTGNVTASGALTVTGGITGGSLTSNGALSVTGTSTLTGNVSAGGTLAVSGNTSVGGDLTVSGSFTPSLETGTFSTTGMESPIVSASVTIKKRGGVVTITGSASKDGSYSVEWDSNKKVGQVPSGYRPNTTVYSYWEASVASGKWWKFEIDTSGWLRVMDVPASETTTTTADFQFAYVVA